ncbi:hypothetical protein L5R14_003314 [Acinetobacter baumannii]|nr:hypothetical protein [Acinetobacter baumannii]
MCENFVNLSTWIERNSGQLQIIIGLLAVFVAFIAYRKVIHQIDLSRIQISILNRERKADLKIQLLSEINIQIKQIVKLQNSYKRTFRDIKYIVDHLASQKSQHLQQFQKTKDLFDRKYEINLPALDKRVEELKKLSNDVFHNEFEINSLENFIQKAFRKSQEIDTAELDYESLISELEVVKKLLSINL